MLVLSRKPGQRIIIGDPRHPIAIIEVESVRGEKVRIGVLAEKETPIHREEVADAIITQSDIDRASIVDSGS